MVDYEYTKEKITSIQKRIGKIFTWEGSVLVLNVHEAMILRHKERIDRLILDELEAEDTYNEVLTCFKKRFMALLISLTEKIMIDRLLDIEKSFSVLYASIILMEEAKDKEEVVHIVLAGIGEYMKCMDNRIKNSCHYLIQSVKEYIHRKLNMKINIGALAKELGTSASYLSRLFHQKEGMTIQEYICYERIRQAEKLLQFSAFTNEEISRCVGFTSISYFGRVLKEATGLTPGQYRQKYRQKCEGTSYKLI
jgi:AraC-like DNA-binding protein